MKVSLMWVALWRALKPKLKLQTQTSRLPCVGALCFNSGASPFGASRAPAASVAWCWEIRGTWGEALVLAHVWFVVLIIELSAFRGLARGFRNSCRNLLRTSFAARYMAILFLSCDVRRCLRCAVVVWFGLCLAVMPFSHIIFSIFNTYIYIY